jgi:hypothetical protein
LKFSNKSCEQLEQKTEELERKNKQLQKLCDIQQALLAQKTENLQDLQEDHAQLKYSHEQLKAKSTVREARSDNSDQKLSPSDSNLCSGDKILNASESSDLNQLHRTLAELTAEVQTSTFQKQKLQREIEDMLNENRSLLKALEQADSEMAELQMKLSHFEENSMEFTVSSPKAGHLLPLTDDLSSPTSPLSHKHLKSPKQGSGHDLSLFGELDSQYSSLQQRYEDIVKECTCSASLIHKRRQSSNAGNLNANKQDSGEMIDTPLKELFDEVFATLKQTTVVADKLIERNQ